MKFYGSKKVYRLESIQDRSRSPHKIIQMKKLNRLLSIFSKAINYGRAEVENNEDGGGGGEGRHRSRSHSRQRSDRPPSAPSQRKPPIIRIRRERSLNGVMWGSPQQVTSDSAATNETYLQEQPTAVTRRSRKRSKKNGPDASPGRGEMRANNLQTISPAVAVQVMKDTLKVQDNNTMTRSRSRGSLKESYSPEAERFVKAAISDIARPVERQIIRIINGNDPSIQSQVLLNTKTSQPWEDLVRDLGMAVKLVRGLKDKKLGKFYLETISGRKIQSYSQLRSELMAGTHAFYVYAPMEDFNDSLPSLAARLAPARTPTNRSVKSNNNNKTRHSRSVDHLPGVDRIHTGATINVQAELGIPPANFPRVNSTPQMANATTQEPPTPPVKKNGSKPSLIPVPNKKQTHSREASSMTELTILVPSSRSNPNFQLLSPQKTATKKRETRKKRSEASGYLAPGSRSRSVSP